MIGWFYEPSFQNREKNMEEIKSSGGFDTLFCGETPVARILPAQGAEDTFEKLGEGVFLWKRKTKEPTDRMRMEALFLAKPDFTLIPGISYNGNGWGTMPEYVGDRDEDGTPWSFAFHRSTVPACTYSENKFFSFALMSFPNDNTASSLYAVQEGEKHVVIFPEEEKPRTLQRHFWNGPFQGTMEKRTEFKAILHTAPSDGTRFRYRTLLDAAWRLFAHPVKAPRKAEELYKLSLAFCDYLYGREPDGFAGFSTGAEWRRNGCVYQKHLHRYQLGWVGQNASMASALIYDYLKTGNRDHLEMGVEADDAWIRFGTLKKGLLASRVDRGEDRFFVDPSKDPDPMDWGEDTYEALANRVRRMREGHAYAIGKDGGIAMRHDACNLGTGAEGYFEAYELLKQAGIEKEAYLKCALDVCGFAMENQSPDGSFAKSWDEEGNLTAKDGTIGCFLILPLLTAHRLTGGENYLESARRGFDFYYGGLERDGFTTAGALDTYSIDKESASPLLKCALRLYETTGEKRYAEAAEKIGWYLCTWMMHFTVSYPPDCLIAKLGFDTFGSTSVSTPHQALDHYALRDVLSFLKLSEITGSRQWRERAAALWCAASQGISDGTLFINRRLRPAGSQDEAIFHTRWGRKISGPFGLSQWLPAWPCAFRLEDLRRLSDWSFFDEGLSAIEGSLQK